MSWHFSRAVVEAYSAATCSGGERFAPSNSTPTGEPSSCSGRTTEFFFHFPCGMTCEPLTASHGADVLTWFLAASLAPTLAPLAGEKESRVPEADSGASRRGSWARYDRDLCLWKTHQFSLAGDLESFSETWPRWGTMRNGECFPLPMPSGLTELRAWITCASESGSLRLPTVLASETRQGFQDRTRGMKGTQISLTTALRLQTPVADDAVNRKEGKINSRGEPKLSAQVKRMPTVRAQSASGGGSGLDGWSGARSMMTPEEVKELTGGSLNPEWVEWFMGWPIGMTGLQPLAMDKFQQWFDSHGDF